MGLIRYIWEAASFPFILVGDNLLLRGSLERNELKLENCLSFGRLRPATYCEIAIRDHFAVLDSNAIEAVQFAVGVGAAAGLGWATIELMLGGLNKYLQMKSLVVALSVWLGTSPVWSYSITSDYLAMEIFGSVFFLGSLYLQVKAIVTENPSLFIGALLCAAAATAWHERFIAAWFCTACAAFVIRRHVNSRSTMALVVACFGGLTLLYFALRWKSGTTYLIGFGGETKSSLDSFLTTRSMSRSLFTAVISLSPIHTENYFFLGARTTTYVALLSSVIGVCLAFWSLRFVARHVKARGDLNTRPQRAKWAIFLGNYMLLLTFIGSVEERLELRWLAVFVFFGLRSIGRGWSIGWCIRALECVSSPRARRGFGPAGLACAGT